MFFYPEPQIDFESRLVNNVQNDCLMTIDGTDFCILQKGVTKKGNLFGPLKYAGKSMLQYELGINILAGNLVWIKGPYPAGAWNDIKIFMNIPVNCLQPDKRTKADNGHVGTPSKSSAPIMTATQKRISGCSW